MQSVQPRERARLGGWKAVAVMSLVILVSVGISIARWLSAGMCGELAPGVGACVWAGGFLAAAGVASAILAFAVTISIARRWARRVHAATAAASAASVVLVMFLGAPHFAVWSDGCNHIEGSTPKLLTIDHGPFTAKDVPVLSPGLQTQVGCATRGGLNPDVDAVWTYEPHAHGE